MLIALVAVSLNTANQAINSLTMNQKGPVLGFNLNKDSLKVILLGEKHHINKDMLLKLPILDNVKTSIYSIYQYSGKIWRIFKVVFLY